MRVVSQVISYVLHPIFIPLYSVGLLLLTHPLEFRGLPLKPAMILATVAYYTLFFPLFATLLLKGLKLIKSFKMEERKERIIPLVVTLFFYIMTFVVLKNQDLRMPNILPAMALGAFVGISATFLINLFQKISLHCVGAGGLVAVGLIMVQSSAFNLALPLVIILMCAGILGSARLYLKAHTPQEVALGYLIGFACQFFAILTYQNF